MAVSLLCKTVQAIDPISDISGTARDTHVDHMEDAASRSGTFKMAASYLVFTLVAGLYLLPFMRIMLPHTNEGTLIYGAVRIVHGEVFSRDFFEVMGPGTFYIVALFFKLFGVTFLATRIWLFTCSLGTALCIYFLSRRVCVGYNLLACAIVAGTSFGIQWPSISHHLDSNLFALLAVVGLVMWEQRRHSFLLYGAGLCAGITAWIHQPKGVLLLLAILLWFLVGTFPGVARGAAFGRVLSGFVVVVLSGGAYFFSKGSLASLYYANVTWPAHNYGTVNTVPYALGIFSEYWRNWAAALGTVAGWPIVFATFLIIPFLFVAIIPAFLLLSALALRPRWFAPTVLLCLLSGWAVWLSEIHRADIYHLVFGSPLLLLVCVHLLSDLKSRSMRWTLQMLTISAFCLMILNLLQVVTARMVPTRVGAVGMLQPDPVMQFVNARIPPGEETLFYPYCPMEYFLTATRNPTRYSILVYNYNTPTEFGEVVRVLEQRRIKYVIWDASFEDETFKVAFPGVAPVPEEAHIVEPYLRLRYAQIGQFGRYRILMRN